MGQISITVDGSLTADGTTRSTTINHAQPGDAGGREFNEARDFLTGVETELIAARRASVEKSARADQGEAEAAAPAETGPETPGVVPQPAEDLATPGRDETGT